MQLPEKNKQTKQKQNKNKKKKKEKPLLDPNDPLLCTQDDDYGMTCI